MSKNCNVEDFAKIIQCYLDCGRNVELGLKMYRNKYPDRKMPLLRNLWNIVKNNDHSEGNESVEFIKSLDDSIVNYFVKNSHATIRKAACIFSLPLSYVSHIYVEREEEIKEMKQQYEIRREQERLSDSIRETIEKTKQALKREILGRSDSEGEITHTISLLEYESNSPGELNMKVEHERNIETSESETADSDNVYCKTKTKKRKKKNSKHGNSKKIRALQRIRKCRQETSTATLRPYRKRTTSHSMSTSILSQNSTILDTQERRPIVYTTRLEEMTICNKNLDHLNNVVIISEILAESKPRFNNNIQTSNRKVINTMCLNILLNKLMNKNTVSGSEKAYDNNDDDDICIITDENDVAQKSNGKHISCNIQTKLKSSGIVNDTDVIVINNIFSNLRDTYVIGGGKVLEYHCTKLDTDRVQITCKTESTLNVCCWFGRQQNVERVWPSTKYPYSRFLKSRHKCSLDKCGCCCKPFNGCAELNPSVHKVANANVVYASNVESDAKINDLILTALNYKMPVANENTINENKNTPPKSQILRFLITADSSKSTLRHEYYEIGGNQDITRFHIDNHYHWRMRRTRCKVCTILAPLFGSNKHTIRGSACCKWKRDSILRPLVSPNTLRFLQNLNQYRYDKCAVCDTVSKPVNKKSAHLFVSVPRIGHATVIERRAFSENSLKFFHSKFGLKDRPLDKHNTTPVGEMPVVTSTFEVKKKLNILCKEIPNLIFEISGLKHEEVNNITDKLMHMHCTVKDDLRVVGLFDSSLQSTTTEELQMFAQIIQNLQNRLKVTPLPPGSSLSLIAEVVDDFKNCNNQSDFQTELVNQGIVVNSKSNAGNMGQPLTINSYNQNTLPFIVKEIGGASMAPHCSNATCQNYRSVTNTSFTTESIANQGIVVNSKSKAGNMGPPPTITSHNQNTLPVIVKDIGGASVVNTFFNAINEDTDFFKTADSFEKFFRHSKKCYEESFKSYIKNKHTVENEDTITIPKISSVFSLQSSTQCQIPASESLSPETEPSTSHCNKVNVQNNVNMNANVETNVIPYPHSTLPPMVQTTGQDNMMVVDSTTGQLFTLIPVNPNMIFENSIKQNIVTIQQGGEGEHQLKLLPPESNALNIGNPDIPFIPVIPVIPIIPITPTASCESMEESILPDILNDIPKNVIVKNEPCNDDVIALDSD